MAALDKKYTPNTIIAPADYGVVVAPNDAVDLVDASRALLIAVAGDVKMTLAGGQTLTVTLPAGWHPIRAVRIWATGTTATGISAWY